MDIRTDYGELSISNVFRLVWLTWARGAYGRWLIADGRSRGRSSCEMCEKSGTGEAVSRLKCLERRSPTAGFESRLSRTTCSSRS